MGESYTTILQSIDLFWVPVFVLLAIAFCLVVKFRWIKPGVLLALLLFKFALCVVVSTYSLTNDLDFDSGGYYQRGRVQAVLVRELVTGQSQDYLRDSPYFDFEGGSSTSRLDSLTGILLAFSGESFMASALTLCCLGAIGQLLIFKYLRLRFPTVREGYFLLILFHPSSAMWSGLLLKDSVGMLALGLLVYNADRILTRFGWRNFLGVLLGSYLALAFRSYILVMFLVFLFFVFWDRRLRQPAAASSRGGIIAFLYSAAAVTLCGAALLYYLKNYGADMLELQSYSNQVYADIGGGSTFNNVQVSFSLSGILAMPMGAVNTLLRPFIWDVSKANQLLAAIENMVVISFVLRGWFVYLNRLGPAAKRQVRSPIWGTTLMAIVCAVGVGLFSSNSGTISRYRIPLIPFLMAGPCVALGWRNAESPGNELGQTRARAPVVGTNISR